MKNKNKMLFKILFIFFGVLCLIVNKKSFTTEETIKINKHEKLLSMMLEQNSGAGDYLQVAQSNWPTEGYIFNKERSGCENGGELSWDDTRKTVVMMGAVSDKCYVYFNKVSIKSLVDYVKSQYTSVQGENNIYYHDSTLTNGAGDNSYRYAGASDKVNNFICFGSTETPCPNDNLYRIVGVFEDNYHGVSGQQLVKLIKYDYANSNLLGTDGDYVGSESPNEEYIGKLTSIGKYHWNRKATDKNSNTWSTSLLNKTNLNTNFINYLGTEWANKIATTTWKVGGNTRDKIYSKATPSVAYQNEIVNPDAANSTDNATTYNAKVGLMYVSDYGFAASPSAWTTFLNKYYESTSIINSNWMYMGFFDWTISRGNDYSVDVIPILYLNYVTDRPVTNTGNSYGVRPCFSLNSSVSYVSGTGTESDPIIIN